MSGNPAWKLHCPPQIPADRSYAAHLFGELKDPRAVPILVPLLQDSEVEDKVIWSLGQIGDKAAIQPLIGILGDGSPDMRFLAIHALQNLRATEALPAIQQLLSDHDPISFDRSVEVSDAAEQAITKLH